jgi:hypothetical protein
MLAVAGLAVNDVDRFAERTAGRLPALHDHAGRTLRRIRDSPQQVERQPNRVCHTSRFGTLPGHSLATCYRAVTISRRSETARRFPDFSGAQPLRSAPAR